MEGDERYRYFRDIRCVHKAPSFKAKKSQSQLAEEAGINRSTLSEIEKGKRFNVITLIQLLRALNLLDVLQQFQAQQQLSPIRLAKLEQAKRKRAAKKKETGQKPKSDW